MNNILISFVGRRVSLVRIFQQTIKELGLDSKVYASDMQPDMAPACYVADECFKLPCCDDDSYIDELLKLCEEKHISLIIPTIDPELMVYAANEKRFKEARIVVLEPNMDFIKICRDKRQIADYFQKMGIAVPKMMDKEHLTFPLFTKPYDGSKSINAYAIMNSGNLSETLLKDPKQIFMEYIDEEEYREFTVDLYYGLDFHVKGIVPRERLGVRGGEVNKGITRKNYILGFLKEKMEYMEGVRGCICMQVFYRESDNDVKAIDINPRFGSGFPLSYYAKANFVEYIIREYLMGETIAYSEAWLDRTLMLRYDDNVIVNDGFQISYRCHG